MTGPSTRAERVDTMFYTDEACTEREEHAKSVKSSLADVSATSRKFDLLDVSMASDNDHGTEFFVVNMQVLQIFLRLHVPSAEQSVSSSRSVTRDSTARQ